MLMFCESNLSFRNQFGPHDVDVGHLVVNFGPPAVDFNCLCGFILGLEGFILFFFPRGVDFHFKSLMNLLMGL